jgi:NADH dehydrogenase
MSRRLARVGYRVRVLTRHPERHRELGITPGVSLVRGDVHEPGFLTAQFVDADVVINLVGILNERERDGSGFRAAHVELPRTVVGACATTGVRRLLHMSSLNADAAMGPSHYLRTKGEGEDLVHAEAPAGLAVTSFRPSIIFGPGDGFFCRFADLLQSTPWVFPLACAQTRFGPVYVGDVVEAFTNSIDLAETFGRRYDLCGPTVYTFKELVQYTAEVIGARRRVLALADSLSRLQARVMEHVPGKPFSRDNYLSAQVDSVCTDPFPKVFGIRPKAVEAMVPCYLGQESARARYAAFRRRSE